MGYRIDYAPKEKLGRKIAGWFLVFLLLVSLFWPRGRKLLGKALYPGEQAVAVVALEHMVQELEEGQGLKIALETFCRGLLGECP